MSTSNADQADSLIQEQYDLYGRIARMEENLRKKGRDNITAGMVQSRLSLLDSHWQQFERNHRILRSAHKEAIKKHDYTQSDLLELAEEEYLLQKGVLLDYAADFARANQPAAGTVAARADAPLLVPNTLPRQSLPQFSGKFEDWPFFKDVFRTMIDGKPINPVEKLQYLKGCLKGDAEVKIKMLPTTADNYPRAWNILLSYYENKRVLVRSCVAKFAALSRMKSETASELNRVLQGITTTVDTLESVGRPPHSSEDLLIHDCEELLEARTKEEWEKLLEGSAEPPTFAALRLFLENRLHTLSARKPSKEDSEAKKAPGKSGRAARTHHAQKQEAGPGKCSVCEEKHAIWLCSKYESKSALERKQHVEAKHLCVNCLGRHKFSECPSKRKCVVCSERHHSSLHNAFLRGAGETSEAKSVVVAHGAVRNRARVLLATARIRVADRFGNLHVARALVDQGSEITIISERLAQNLGLPRQRTSVAIFGVGGNQTGVARGRVELTMSSRSGQETISTRALVLPRLTAYATSAAITKADWQHLDGLELADPEFGAADAIDVLLGADVYSRVLCDGLRKGGEDEPVAQNTIFGWVLSGMIDSSATNSDVTTHHCAVGASLSTLVRRFWEQEELPSGPTPLTPEEEECESLFARSHARRPDGRYEVRLPISSPLPDISATRAGAVRSLHQMERRFLKQTEFKRLYVDFMSTYEKLGHMSRIPSGGPKPGRICFLPHHGVMREASSSTKLRVVFNGSWATPTGHSLNQHLHVGQNLLPALTDVLLRWRWHRYVLASDVEKMYRQILVHPDDRDLQRIVWREGDHQTTAEFVLNTVAYGLACAPFLAIRTLQQLARDEESRFPLGSAVLLRDVYMDDVLTGADSLEEALKLQS